ncbi:MAG: hypothetical protein GEU88_18435 [Solirubrobacterales bacterium]|nr:hypothetical protein [Solirubrobacterales bacterium]
MSDMSVSEARAEISDVVARAEYAGETVYLTKHGRRAGAVAATRPRAITRDARRVRIGTDELDQPVWLRLRDGRRADRALSAAGHAELWFEALHAGRPGLVEVVGARREASGRLGRMRRHRRQNFIVAGERALARRRALMLDRAGREVFATPATLTAPEPGDDAVAELALVWVDIDEPAAIERLRAFGHRPHMVVASGGGGVHAYWLLSFPVPRAGGEAANRALASAVGGDLASTNGGRLMRTPGTRNRKAAERWCRVLACDLARAPHDLAALVEGLTDPRARRRGEPAGGAAHNGELDRIAPPAYFRALTGTEVPSEGGYVRCPSPAHEDRHPSCFVYPNPGEGWCCFACLVSGSAIDLASVVAGGPWGSELRGDRFRAARERALRALGLEPARGGGR